MARERAGIVTYPTPNPNLLTVPPRNTDDDQFRARMETKRAENARRRALYEATIAPPVVTVPKVQPAVQACPTCGHPTRPLRTTIEDYPGTRSRQGRGLCGGCKSRIARARAAERVAS